MDRHIFNHDSIDLLMENIAGRVRGERVRAYFIQERGEGMQERGEGMQSDRNIHAMSIPPFPYCLYSWAINRISLSL